MLNGLTPAKDQRELVKAKLNNILASLTKEDDFIKDAIMKLGIL